MEIKISVDALTCVALGTLGMDRDLARRFRSEVGEGEPCDPREPDLLPTLKAAWEASAVPRVRAILDTMISHMEHEQLACDRLNKVAMASPVLTEAQRARAKDHADAVVAVQWHEAYRLVSHDIAAESDDSLTTRAS